MVMTVLPQPERVTRSSSPWNVFALFWLLFSLLRKSGSSSGKRLRFLVDRAALLGSVRFSPASLHANSVRAK